MLRSFSLFLGAILLTALAPLPGGKVCGQEYYMIMFGSQRVPPNPNYSHTFATFVKVTPGGPAPFGGAVVEPHTISWLPVNLKVRVNALRPECGHNFDLPASLASAYESDQRVSMWGPYPIHPDLYDRALRRKAELENGHIQYKAVDTGYRSDRVTNCIHAVSTIVDGPRLRVASPGWGESASFFVLKRMEPWILSKEPAPWVGSAVGLDCYPIIYRDYRNPRSNAVFGPLFRVFGSERNLEPTFGPPMR